METGTGPGWPEMALRRVWKGDTLLWWSPARAQIWWDRDVSPQATRACHAEFTVGKVRRTLEVLNPATAAATRHIYDDTMTFGGHSNERGVASSLRIDRSRPGAVTLGMGFLHPNGTAMQAISAAAKGILGQPEGSFASWLSLSWTRETGAPIM